MLLALGTFIMKIAIINETSAADKNKDILAALRGRGHTIINAGMIESGAQPELTYIHTGFISALLLNAKRADFVVGGCGTGQGYLNSVMQYPNVFCGLIANPLDAWLFTQINGGNCISLPLNFGYGWAGDVNLQFVFDKIFSVEPGCGYPAHRKESQKNSRLALKNISAKTHFSFARIIETLGEEMVRQALFYPGIKELLDVDSVEDVELKKALKKFINKEKR